MNRPLSGTLMDPLIHLIAAESSFSSRRWTRSTPVALQRGDLWEN